MCINRNNDDEIEVDELKEHIEILERALTKTIERQTKTNQKAEWLDLEMEIQILKDDIQDLKDMLESLNRIN